MSDIVEEPFVIAPGTVQPGKTRVRAFSSGELVAESASRSHTLRGGMSRWASGR